ncbi:uncharacterized protein LOC125652148 isoform X2 [Ostrea edulis]|uniref:uncharacterized protein LOC125652148 isoform X2 n=1 Tax=Ostrea edulis TaxID=37623 RepID=UPI002094B570|nr:uncharacterized protein LOC125652148 isoform X2 [Ostrea edulis]
MAFVIVFIGVWTLVTVQAKEFQIGGDLELPCNVTASFTRFAWTKPGSVIAECRSNKLNINDPRAHVSTSQTDSNFRELVIRGISNHDTGNYTCTVYFNGRQPSETVYIVNVVELTSTMSSADIKTDYTPTNMKTTKDAPINGETKQRCSYVNFVFLFLFDMFCVSIFLYV